MQLLISESPHISGFALPDDRGFVLAGCLDMAVKAVIRKIDLSADEPLRPGIFPFEYLVPLFEPVQLGGNAPPKFLRLLD